MRRGEGASPACEQARRLVAARRDATLTPAETAGLAAHLDGCEACRAYADLHDARLDAVGALAGVSGPPDLARKAVAQALAGRPAPLLARLMGAVPGSASTKRRSTRGGGAGMLQSRTVRLAAMMAVVAAVIVVVQARRPEPARAEASPGQLEILDKAGKPAGLCPLKHTDVTADIAGYVARVTVRQEFVNPSQTPIEAVYTFPLPEDAAVDDMTMHIGRRVVRGKTMRREEARQVYDEAKSQGKAAALLDQERPNIFTQAVANIMPGDTVTIEISYVNLLKYREGSYEFTFPMVVGPRYTPGGGYQVPGQRGAPSPPAGGPNDGGTQAVVTDADKITPPIAPQGTRAGHTISLAVNVDAGLPLQDIRSVLHDVDIRRTGPGRAAVQLRDKDEIPNRDFVLRYSAAGSEVQEGLLAHASGKAADGGYFTLILQPPLAPPANMVSPKEMVFVIDQTGSQDGWPIRKSKETMAYCIQHLNPGDTFQLIGFNTDVYPCFPVPVAATQENVQEALRYLKGIEAGGGTDILKAADYALRIPEDPERLRIVCFMTDGYVGDDMQILQYVREHRGTTRMFPFGIGDSVNRFLIEGMAREGRGAPEFVSLSEDGGVAARRFYDRVAHPLLLDVQVDWGGLPVEDVYPKQIPDVFSFGPVILKGRYSHPAEGDVTVRGLLRGQPWSRTIHVVLPAQTEGGSAIPTLWARERIEDLQAQDWVGAQTGQPKPDTREQIIATALEYRLMSQYTSFVAVEEKVVNPGGKQETKDVPIEMAHGVSHRGIFGGEAGEAEDAGVSPGAVPGGRMARRVVMAKPTAPADKFTDGPAVAGPGPTPHAVSPGGGPGAASSAGATRVGAVDGRAKIIPGAAAQQPSASGSIASLRSTRRTRTLVSTMVQDYDEPYAPGGVSPSLLGDLALGKADAYRKLAPMPADARRGVLERAKLSDSLRRLLTLRRKEKAPADGVRPAPVRGGRVDVVVWLNAHDAASVQALARAGLVWDTTVAPGKVMRGSIAVERLDALLALPAVRRVEPEERG